MTSGRDSALLDATFTPDALSRLKIYADLLLRWNAAINLVSGSSIETLWERHVLDSAQLFRFASENSKVWGDLGSGGGFPGIVVAAMAAAEYPDLKFTLVEADQRKAEFLRTVSRETGLAIKVLCDRAERAAPLGADVVSARALAPLDTLCSLAGRHLGAGGVALFLKGRRATDEVDVARRKWNFHLTTHRSAYGDGSILEVGGISHV